MPSEDTSCREEKDTPTRLLRMQDVSARVGLSTRTIQRLVKTDSFPAPVSLSSRAIAFVEAEVEAWIAARPRARGKRHD
jgi:prophage regulatory protein